MRTLQSLACLFAVIWGLSGQSDPSAPRYLSHILGYIALDYSAAVDKAGIVVNESEYSEMKEFVELAVKESSQIPETATNAPFLEGLNELRALIFAKAQPATVTVKSRSLEARVIELCQIQRIPSQWPSIDRGAAAYTQHCAACHGATGFGDGPQGAGLDPAPADFHNAERMSAITPFNIFNAIRMGVPGTGMTAFPLSDEDIWNLVFHVASLRHQAVATESGGRPFFSLEQLSTHSDDELLSLLPNASPDNTSALAHARRYRPRAFDFTVYVDIALDRLSQSVRARQEGNWDRAEKFALAAYLDGVELFERKLRSKDPQFVLELEQKMGHVRAQITSRQPESEFLAAIEQARASLEAARPLLIDPPGSPVATALMSAGIVLREALEAVLILVALLGVIRTANVPAAAVSVHLGWIFAVVSGFVMWLFSGWVLALSGAQRELLEGFVTLFAVAVLLYFGFWMHRKTELGRWRNYLGQIATQLADRKKLFGLFGIAFMAVFREAFETVLFLRALALEASTVGEWWIGAGVASAFLVAVVMALLALKMARSLPVRQMFLVSSTLLIVLAVTLTGKGVRAFQETGLVGMTEFPLRLRWEFMGVFPTWETLTPQFLIILLGIVVWSYERYKLPVTTEAPRSQ